MAVAESELFQDSEPEILIRIEVGTIGRQRDESEAKLNGTTWHWAKSPACAVQIDRLAKLFVFS